MLFQALLLLSITLLWLWFVRKRNYWKNKGVTQVEGPLWKFTFGDKSLSEYYKDIYDKYEEEQIGMYLGMQPALMVKNMDDLQAVLASDFQSFYKRGIFINESDKLADSVLFTDDFGRWKILRSKMTPVFTSLRLKTMFYSIEACARECVDLIENDEKLRVKPFDVMYTYTAASIGAAVFGIDTKGKSFMKSPFVDMAWKALSPSFKTNMIFLLSSTIPILHKIMQLRFFGEHEEFFIGAIKSVLEARRKSEKRLDFIDVCLELQKNGLMKEPTTGYELEPTDELMAAQAFFFFIAGADTTANAIHFTLLELSSNQDILAKLHASIDEIFEGGKTELTYEDMDKLQYLDMCITEGMRKYPPIGTIQRVCVKDTVLPSNNLKIEKDTAILVPIFAIHRDPRLFSNPDIYDPERFAPDRIKEMHHYSNLAFGGGNRVCIGLRFARLQMKAGIAWLLRRFTLAEQDYKPHTFGRSSFSLRDPDATYQLIPRNIK